MSDVALILDGHAQLLDQVLNLLQQLQASQPAGFRFADKVGPHLRHILEHYKAMFDAMSQTDVDGDCCIDYDARARNRLVESDPSAAKAMIATVQRELERAQTTFPQDLAAPMVTRLTTGNQGQVMVKVPTSLGRELLFLESHTVHHLALLAECLRALGITLDPSFGKAPATIAFERSKTSAGR